MHDCKNEGIHELFHMLARSYFIRSHNVLSKLGLYPGQPHVLLSLMEKDGQSQTELANDRKVKASTNTVTLNRMVKAGLIEKKKDEFDQRITRIYMTAKGRDVVKEVVELKKQLDELCFLEFSEEEKTTLRELLKKMSENIKIDPHEFQPPDMHDLRKNCRH